MAVGMLSFFNLDRWPLKSLVWMCIVTPVCQCSGDAQRRATTKTGSFADPAASVRPRFRYWLPDASVDVDTVVADIAAAGSIGAGGIELLPFFEYGGELGSMPSGANWSTYNFGTVPFRKLFTAALDAHEQLGLVMDFALGPNQGQGVPASPDDLGLQWDLVTDLSSREHGYLLIHKGSLHRHGTRRWIGNGDPPRLGHG